MAFLASGTGFELWVDLPVSSPSWKGEERSPLRPARMTAVRTKRASPPRRSRSEPINQFLLTEGDEIEIWLTAL
jgi:hypothetical protein